MSDKNFRVAIVGSRLFNNYPYFEAKLKTWEAVYGVITEIVSGGATGVDRLAERYADSQKRRKRIHRADWNKYGNAAGPMRNTTIVNDGIQALIAFPDAKSVGTRDSITKARAKGIPVFEYVVNIR